MMANLYAINKGTGIACQVARGVAGQEASRASVPSNTSASISTSTCNRLHHHAVHNSCWLKPPSCCATLITYVSKEINHASLFSRAFLAG